MSKNKIIKDLTVSRQKIINLITPLSEKKWDEIFLGKWTLKDFVAHLIGWDIWGLKATKEIIKGKLPTYYQYFDGSWDRINDKFVSLHKQEKKKDLLRTAKKSHQQLVRVLEKIPAHLYNHDFGIRWKGTKITLASDTYWQAADESNHVNQIQRWLETGKPQ